MCGCKGGGSPPSPPPTPFPQGPALPPGILPPITPNLTVPGQTTVDLQAVADEILRRAMGGAPPQGFNDSQNVVFPPGLAAAQAAQQAAAAIAQPAIALTATRPRITLIPSSRKVG